MALYGQVPCSRWAASLCLANQDYEQPSNSLLLFGGTHLDAYCKPTLHEFILCGGKPKKYEQSSYFNTSKRSQSQITQPNLKEDTENELKFDYEMKRIKEKCISIKNVVHEKEEEEDSKCRKLSNFLLTEDAVKGLGSGRNVNWSRHLVSQKP